MSPDIVNSLHSALLNGLEDYSVDERGDVGSWIRLACIQGLTRFSVLLISNASSIPNFDVYFPPMKYQQTVAGILKQGVERLDNLRQEAGECFMQLLDLTLPNVRNSHDWCIPGLSLLKELFQRYVILPFNRI
jgi:tubulin-specific chaperone D